MKKLYTLLHEKIQFQDHVLFCQKEREDFVDKLIAASTANLYDSDGLGSMCVTVQSKSSDLKILELQD
jgi:hypothetical protein